MAKLTYTLPDPLEYTSSNANLYFWFPLDNASDWLKENGLVPGSTINSVTATVYIASTAQTNVQVQASLYNEQGGNSCSGLVIENEKLKMGGSTTQYKSAKTTSLLSYINSGNSTAGYFQSDRSWLRVYTYLVVIGTRDWSVYYTLDVDFTPPVCQITTSVSPAGYGTTTGDGTYAYGTKLNVTATAKPECTISGMRVYKDGALSLEATAQQLYEEYSILDAEYKNANLPVHVDDNIAGHTMHYEFLFDGSPGSNVYLGNTPVDVYVGTTLVDVYVGTTLI